MLSKHERDRLAEIEAALASADPEFAESFERFQPRTAWIGVRRLLLFTALTLVGLTSLVFLVSGLVWTSVGLAMLTAVGATAVAYGLHRKRRT